MAVANPQPAYGPWQAKSLWASASRIEIKDTPEFFNQWLMTMPKHNHVRIQAVNSLAQVHAELLRVSQNMSHENPEAKKFEADFDFEAWRYVAFVDVSSHGRHGREVLQLGEDLQIADIAGMQDVIDRAEH